MANKYEDFGYKYLNEATAQEAEEDSSSERMRKMRRAGTCIVHICRS
jgi:hypothetical protein